MSTVPATETAGWTDERRPDQMEEGTRTDEEPTQDEEDEETDTTDNNEERDGNADETEEQQDGEAGEETRSRNAEAAKYRKQRNEARERADDYGRRLFTELVRSTGKLTDPTDMEYNAELLDSPDALQAAVDELATRKPHLKARRFPDMGQHGRQQPTGPSLGDLLRGNA